MEAVGPSLVRQVLRQFGSVRLRAFGGSMLPAIRPGDLLEVRETAPARVAAGDVVLVERHGRLFAHRVVWCEKDLLKTRGDAHWRADPIVTATDLLGVVTGVCRDGFTAAPLWRRPDGTARRARVRTWARNLARRRKVAAR